MRQRQALPFQVLQQRALMSVRSQASSRSNKAVTATWCWRKSPSRAKKNSLSNRYSSRR